MRGGKCPEQDLEKEEGCRKNITCWKKEKITGEPRVFDTDGSTNFKING
jgi:hypothetical protein